MAFPKLKKLGLTSKRSSGLSNGFTYIQPGKTKKDVRGQDYFVCKEELMEYLDLCDLVLDVEQDTPQRYLGPILHAVSSDDGGDDAKNALPSPNPSEVTYVSNEMIFGEVNLTTLDDNPDELTGLDSDGENDDSLDDWSSEEHDESSDRDAGDNDAVVQPDIMFDEEFLAAVGGVDSLESIRKTVLDDMATTGERTLLRVLHIPVHKLPDPKDAFEDYPRLYDGPFGLTEDTLAAAAAPSGAFLYFMTPELWDDIPLQSKNYFIKKHNECVDGRSRGEETWISQRGKKNIRKKLKNA
ncbi:LOW QUALITY PROTEIN: Hypothetical protein PHPALM_8915 [Phytophthora palmivora]|uniref:Uncharacterized protein n=1 Tax=Phytophthora palmivora TaxID=4796 RepID=A0A2P4Y8N1_9STRA|nr:LOW QUALITY PROTEIN: Hypothetical protein PHPALM_8915 [Phytophthora palmivora]